MHHLRELEVAVHNVKGVSEVCLRLWVHHEHLLGFEEGNRDHEF